MKHDFLIWEPLRENELNYINEKIELNNFRIKEINSIIKKSKSIGFHKANEQEKNIVQLANIENMLYQEMIHLNNFCYSIREIIGSSENIYRYINEIDNILFEIKTYYIDYIAVYRVSDKYKKLKKSLTYENGFFQEIESMLFDVNEMQNIIKNMRRIN